MDHACARLIVSAALLAALAAGQTRRDLRYEKIGPEPPPATQSQAPKGKQWALVVGISTYRNVPPQAQLKYAHRDAEDFARFLRSESGGGIPATQMRVLTNGNATLSAIRAAMHTWLPRVVSKNDVVYLFFAGHGVVAENEGYFVATDSDPQNLHATGLSFREVNETLTTKLKADAVILFADACHAGTIGWTTESSVRGDAQARLESLGGRDQSFLKLLASRPSERSFEDERWDGGHGVFTYALLNGLRGGAEKDHDGAVRVSELIEYISQVVPQQTNKTQNPRVAGNFEPRLVLAKGAAATKASPATQTVSLDLIGPAGASIYVDRAYRGSIRTGNDLRLEALAVGTHRIEVELPGGDSFEHTFAVAPGQSRIDLNALPGFALMRLDSTIKQGRVLEAGGAWDYYRSLNFPPEHKMLADSVMAAALENIGQECVNDYVQSSTSGLKAKLLTDAAEAYNRLKQLRPNDNGIEAKRLFCLGRAQIATGRFEEAEASLRASLNLDNDFACAFNALGVALDRLGRSADAKAAFEKAAQLTPEWFLPPLQLAQQYMAARQPDKAVSLLEKAVRFNPRAPLAHWSLLRALRALNREQEFATRANELLTQFPNYAPGYLEVAAYHEAHGDYSKAARAYDLYLTLAPNFEDSAAVRTRADRARSLDKRGVPTLNPGRPTRKSR